LAKRGLNRALESGLEEALEYEAQLQAIAGRSADHREGVAAFVEKRRRGVQGRVIVGVVGAGTMGAGIAQVCLHAGHEVLLYDVDHAAIERGRERIADGLARLVAKGRLPADAPERLLGACATRTRSKAWPPNRSWSSRRRSRTSSSSGRSSARWARAHGRSTLLATNTSALSVSEIAAASGVADRVLGLHFFNPAPVMPLVEVVAGERHAVSHAGRRRALRRGAGQDAGRLPRRAGLHRQPRQSAVHARGAAHARGG
jgi:hypothetical protein